MKREFKIGLVGIVTGVAMTKIGEKVLKKVATNLIDNAANNAEQIMETIKEIGEDCNLFNLDYDIKQGNISEENTEE